MATDVFLQIEGIKGESHVAGHIDEIDIESWSWGLTQTGTMQTGGGGGTGKVNVHDMTIQKHVDKSSTNLLLFCANGKHIKKAVLTVRKAGEKPVDYWKMTLEDLLISSVQQSGHGGGAERVAESVSLNFAKFQIDYQMQKADGTGTPAGNVKWDVKANHTF